MTTITSMTLQQMRDKIREQTLPELEALAARGDTQALEMLQAERKRRGLDPDTGILTHEGMLRQLPKEAIAALWQKEAAENARQERERLLNEAGTVFVLSQPKYEANRHNGKILLDYLAAHPNQYPPTPDGIDTAFHDLVAAGQLTAKAVPQKVMLKSQIDPRDLSIAELKKLAGG